MPRHWLFPLIGLFVFLLPQVTWAEAEKDDDGFVKIFNGKDLTNWVVEGWRQYPQKHKKDPIWIVEEDKIVCRGRDWGFLRYDKKLTDFIVRLEFRAAKKCNSGLGIRGGIFQGNRWKTAPSWTGYEMQILDDAGKRPTPYSTGALYRYIAPRTNAIKPAGQWNTVEIRCQGPRIQITLNDQHIQDVDQSTVAGIKEKPLSGYFSLQDHGSRIEFRGIRLKEL